MARRKRERLIEAAVEPPSSQKKVSFVTSGSILLDLVLSGGWAQGRIINIVGDFSSGKTLLAVEATANFLRQSSLKRIRYAECEDAFDQTYARTMGMPEGLDVKQGLITVEDFFDDLDAFLNGIESSKQPAAPSLYVLDSLDAISDEAEMKRGIGEGSYGATKAKQLSQLFRRLGTRLSECNCTLIIISQLRDRIGVTFGETKMRSGGKALNFYASQILWLSEIGKLRKQALSAERVVGVRVLARTKKNKVGTPFRDVELSLLFNYGIDDQESTLIWLKHNKVLTADEVDDQRKALLNARRAHDRAKIKSITDNLHNQAVEHWFKIEAILEPPLRKYEDA